MFKTVWKFKIRPESQVQFEQAYGRDGDWAQLFQKAEGYIKTELFRNVEDLSYITIDTWRSVDDFENFKAHWCAEYKELDQRFENLTISESRIC